MDHIKTALVIIAWFGALCAPPLVAIFSWKLSRRLRNAWLAHLAFLPGVLACEWLFASLLFWASGDSGDGPPGLGLALVPCLGSMLLSIVIYFGTLITVFLHKQKRDVLGER